MDDADDAAFGWHTVVAALVGRGIADAETAFNFVDTDSSGTISYRELQVAVAELGLTAGAATCRRMMEEADADGDGEVSLDEFLAWQVRVQGANDEAWLAPRVKVLEQELAELRAELRALKAAEAPWPSEVSPVFRMIS